MHAMEQRCVDAFLQIEVMVDMAQEEGQLPLVLLIAAWGPEDQ